MGTFRFKSDLRNHQAIVQPRLYTSTIAGLGWLRRSLFSGYQYPANLVGPGARGFSAAAPLLVAWEPQPEYLLMQARRHWRPGPGGTVTIHGGRVVQHPSQLGVTSVVIWGPIRNCPAWTDSDMRGL